MLREQGVQFSCDTDNQTMLRVKGQGLVSQELSQSFIILEELLYIGKYLCMSSNKIMSIHYVTTGELIVQIYMQTHYSNDHELHLQICKYKHHLLN